MVYPLLWGLHEDKGFETFPLWRVNIRHFFPISDTPALPSNLTWVYLSHTLVLVRDLSLATEHLSTHRTNTWPVFCQTGKSFRSDYSNRRFLPFIDCDSSLGWTAPNEFSTGSRPPPLGYKPDTSQVFTPFHPLFRYNSKPSHQKTGSIRSLCRQQWHYFCWW